MPVDHAILTELRKLAWASSLSDETLNSISENVIVAEVPTGEVVLAAGAPLEDVYFVVQGRLSATIRDAFGNLVVSRVMSRGMAVGVFAMALGQDASLQVVATERTLLYRLPLSVLLQLTSRFQDFQLAMFRLAAGNVRSLVLTNRAGSHQAVVGVLHHSHATRQFAKSLIQRLHQLEETVFVVGDDSQWKPDGGILFETWFRDRTLIANEERQRQLESWRHRGRLLFDLAADHDPDTLARLLSNADSILWCVTPQDAEAAMRTIRRLLHIDRGWSQKICLVWILEPDTKSVPYLPELGTITARDFKVSLHPAGDGRGRLLSQGLERVVRYLRGIQIGLALGGGAARGMAHLGVLKALEDNGIFVDMVAGTSAGAMTGTIYASGMDPEFSTNCFKSDLQPSWFFRCLPGGGYWYLVHKYRRNRFDPMLRKYLDNARLEQLVVPMHTIAVDLVEGKTLVRSTGDAVHNILESINLPPLSLPIIKSGSAIVDGGLLKNVPADVLVSQGCNFVMASTVSAQLERDFMGIRSSGKGPRLRLTASIEVMMRSFLVQSYNMNDVGVQPADVVIAPNVTAFDLSEFTRADEMARIGQQTTLESIPRIRAMLAKLDSKLFPES